MSRLVSTPLLNTYIPYSKVISQRMMDKNCTKLYSHFTKYSPRSSIPLKLTDLRPIALYSSAADPKKTEKKVKKPLSMTITPKQKFVIAAHKGVIDWYSILTYPIYALLQKSWQKVAASKAIKGVKCDKLENSWVSAQPKCPRSLELQEHQLFTLEKLFAYSMAKYQDRPCLGTRPIMSQVTVHDEKLGNVVKNQLGDYEWKTYREVDLMSTQLTSALVNSLGLRSKDTIAVFADTREEWLITAMAAFKSNISLATIFTTLGDDGVVSALNETGVDCLFTSEDLMPRCYELLKKTPNIKRVVYMQRPSFMRLNSPKIDATKVPSNIQLLEWSSLVEQGKALTSNQVPAQPKPTPEDTAIIMYTSGSTGIPKGVVLSHLNASSVLGGMADAVYSVYGENRSDDSYLAFLPLAHILELTSEANTILHGAKIGYGTPHTLTDNSPGVMEGSKGDAVVLQPTIMAVVPLVLEKLSKAIHSKLEGESNAARRQILDIFFKYKMKWISRGFETPLLDKLLFHKIKKVVGGNIRMIICGGSHLAPQTQEYIRTVFSTKLLIGYGLTETSGCTTCTLAPDLSLGRMGAPSPGITVKLVDWAEGGYRVTDKPHPRGEIYVSGPTVAKGYFKVSPETNSDFFTDENNVRWFKTGDIAEVHPDGAFSIVDRRKDLVKLSSGEFLSLGKVESILKMSPLVESVCVWADARLTRPIAIIVPTVAGLTELGSKLGLKKEFKELTQNPQIMEKVLEEIKQHSLNHHLGKYEIAKFIYMTPDPWTPESGLVTASLKLRRANVSAHFKPQIEQILAKIK